MAEAEKPEKEVKKIIRRKMNKKKVKTLLKSFRDGATITAACKAADISRNTLWMWERYWPNLAVRIEEIKGSRIGYVKDAIYANAIQGKEQSQKLFCEISGILKRPTGPNVTVPVTVNANQTVANVTIPVATPEEAERVKVYAQLIRSHNLVSRVLGAEGSESIHGDIPEGRQGDASPAGGAPQGDTVAH